MTQHVKMVIRRRFCDTNVFMNIIAACGLILLLMLLSGCNIPSIAPGVAAEPVRNYDSCPFQPHLMKELSVLATQPWQDTGVIVQSEDELFFEAEGQWGIYYPTEYLSSPEGRIGLSTYYPPLMPDIPYGRLIGKIGNGVPFEIGAQGYAIVANPGALYLAINDAPGWYHDNRGEVKVVIFLKRSTGRLSPTLSAPDVLFDRHEPVSGPWGPVPVVSYTYDAISKRGELSVDISGRGIEVREWIIQNIGKICSSKNVTMEAGKENETGGRYRVLNENVKDDILTIEFEAAY